ncbi:hypothetical protein BpHYR1_045054 [Brachionus plicatilis]|uniref:Uncharacterized protein n=1 Tax=Brachionus plicatilis TaxID=10195 RepID=A0A3M7QKN7_BRAPC|nr:hypothetical protein BpHYR1_045054 [Brachionus plicatilis]
MLMFCRRANILKLKLTYYVTYQSNYKNYLFATKKFTNLNNVSPIRYDIYFRSFGFNQLKH